MKNVTALKVLLLIVLSFGLWGCTTSTTVDEYRVNDTVIEIDGGEKLVVLGRRQAGEYETEHDFIACIEGKINGSGTLTVFPERQFLDLLYPWFEPRTAPLQLPKMQRLMEQPLVRSRVDELGIRYLIWVDGNTETLSSDGSVSCAIGPGGGGCYGFATWDKASDYEAVIWDLQDIKEEGRVSVDARGTSYLLAIGAPIPFIARVQGEACESFGRQLQGFFSAGSQGG
ncbi:MAG: hypothetical protein ACWA5K_07370 [bacterium]